MIRDSPILQAHVSPLLAAGMSPLLGRAPPGMGMSNMNLFGGFGEPRAKRQKVMHASSDPKISADALTPPKKAFVAQHLQPHLPLTSLFWAPSVQNSINGSQELRPVNLQFLA